MPFQEIPLSGGAFENVDDFELIGTPNGATLKNFLLNDAGSNISRGGLGPATGYADVDSPCVGAAYFKGQAVFVTEDRSIYSLDSDGTVTNVTGAKLGGTLRPTFASDGDYLAIAGGGAPITYGGSGTTQVMAGSPPACSHILYLDGYWIANLTGTNEYQYAGPTEVTRLTWNSLDFASAEGLPDSINAIATSLRELYIFGMDSTEILQNYGQADVPFVRTFFLDKGLIAPYSVVKANNTLFWLTQERQFIQLQSRTPTLISNPFHRVIKRMSVVEDCFGYQVDFDDQFLIVWVFPTEERAFWYSYKTQQWGELSGFINGVDVQFRLGAYMYNPSNNKHLVGDNIDGKIWEWSRSYQQDVSDELKRIRRTGFITHGGLLRKRSNRYRFWIKRGEGASGSSALNSPKMEVRFRDDGGPWSDPQVIDLGLTGDFEPYVDLSFRGIYRARQIEMTITDAVDIWINKVEEDFEAMSS